MAIRINTATRNAMADAGADNLTVCDVYGGGSQPASANNAVPGGHTLLVSITIAWVAGANGVKVVVGTPSATAVASGTATWGRFRSSGDTLRIDGAVGSEFTLDNTAIVSGGTVTLSSVSLTMPSGEA